MPSARIANDHQAERKLAEIRVRAKRKCGEALRDSAKASRGPDESGCGSQRSPRATPGAKRPGHRSARPTNAPKTLRALGVSKHLSSDWPKLAAVPEKIFENRMGNPFGVSSTAEIVLGKRRRSKGFKTDRATACKAEPTFYQ
jgi:hypothetical protein